MTTFTLIISRGREATLLTPLVVVPSLDIRRLSLAYLQENIPEGFHPREPLSYFDDELGGFVAVNDHNVRNLLKEGRVKIYLPSPHPVSTTGAACILCLCD